MLITGDRLRDIAGSFLETLEREDICTFEDLRSKEDERLEVNDDYFIEITLDEQTHSYSLFYISHYNIVNNLVGLPIIVSISKDGKVLIGVKAARNVRGYSPIKNIRDRFGNIGQNKYFYSGGLEGAKEELTRLRDSNRLFD